jgi:uncharacterized protein
VAVRALVGEEAALLQRVRDAFRAVEPGARIILYGSRARGDAEPDADWDFLILLDGPVDQRRAARVRHRLFDLKLALDGCPVLSAVVESEAQWNTPLFRAMPFHESVTREGIEL